MPGLYAMWRARVAPAAIAVTVFAFAAGSSSVREVTQVGLTLRWIALFGLCGIALAGMFLRGNQRDVPAGLLRFLLLPATLLALAFLSVGWSVDPRITFERAVTLAVLFVTAAAFAVATMGDAEARRSLFVGLGLGAGAILIVGAVMLPLDSTAAAQPGVGLAWRFRGFGQDPNTVAELGGVVAPILGVLAVTARGLWSRIGWFAVIVVLLVSADASQSRGGIIAATLGLLIVFSSLTRGQQKAATLAVVVTAFVLGFGLRVVGSRTPYFKSQVAAVSASLGTTQPPTPTKAGSSGGTTPTTANLGHATIELPLRQDEIGSPLLSTTKGSTLASGRVAEWKGTLKQIESRPLLGYGFGTETLVFVDRYYYFQGGTAENSFLGLMLELGGVGLLVLLSTFARLAWHGIRACRAVGGGERALLIGSLGVLASALALMFVQSYIYSVGNVGSLTVWFALFLLGVTAFAPATSGQAAGADADG